MVDKIKYSDLNMPDMYKEGIERGKDKTFVVYQRFDGSREEYSFNYIQSQSDTLLEKMKESGLKEGDRVAVISSLRPWWYALTYACLRGKYIMVCIDPGVPQTQVNKMLADTDVRSIFTTLKSIIIPEEYSENVPIYSIEENFPLINNCSKINFLLEDSTPMPKDTFFILFSSGTTGENRKAVLLKHSSITKAIEYGSSNDAGVYKKTSVYTPNKCDLMLFPPYHIAGLLCATYDIYNNTKLIILERLTPNNLISALTELKPDCICTVPSMLNSLYKKIVASYSKTKLKKSIVNLLISESKFLRKNFGIKAGKKLLSPINKQALGGNMKRFMIGASPFDKVPNEFFLNMGIDVIMAYGLTELGAPLASTGEGYYPGTTGRVVRHKKDIDIRIVNKDENGRGEVEVLSPYRMISYLNPKDNEGIFTGDGYFKTGDLGYFDSNDCLNICGRIKETIVLRNGEKLLPEEIESKYQDIFTVKDIAAFKVPGEGGCDDFAIAITADKSKGINEDAIIKKVYERMDHIPKMYRAKNVYIVKEFPYSSSHKVQRFRLTEMVIKGQNEPTTDALMVPIDEDETVAKLRRILVQVGGDSWKNEKLSQGTLLNLDSLSLINLFVAIQDEWQIDLFQTNVQPESFGELLDVVKNFNGIDKVNKQKLDLSKYPLKSSPITNIACKPIKSLAKTLYRVKCYGIENLPKDTNFLLCPNHRTDVDPVFISSILPNDVFKKTCFVGKSDLIENKIFKQLSTSFNYIPIERVGNSIQSLNRIDELLKEGWNILIFPEGTSVQNHEKLFKLKEGPARLSISSRKPIVPVHILGVAHNDQELSTFSLPKLSSKITIRIGKPIYPENMDPQELNKVLTEKIEELV